LISCPAELTALRSLCEGKNYMRKKLLVAVLALMAIGATGCIIIDAEKVQSRTPATIRSDECVVYQGHAVDTPTFERDGCESAAVAEP
jgi:hypothetical protein